MYGFIFLKHTAVCLLLLCINKFFVYIFSSESEDDYYEVKRAPMMTLLPGSRPQDLSSSPTPASKKISDATQSSVKTEDEEESEYTYETGKGKYV